MASFQTLSGLWAAALLAYLLCTPAIAPSHPVAHTAQIGTSVLLLAWWAYIASTLGQRKREAMKPVEQQRLAKAIPLSGDTGVSDAWYDAATHAVSTVHMVATVVVGCAVGLAAVWAAPTGSDVRDMLVTWLNHKWNTVQSHYPHHLLFTVCAWGIFVVPYYAIAAIGAYLDFAKPSLLRPFKIQEDKWPTVGDYVKAALLALFNTGLLLIILYAIYPVYQYCAPAAFGELPPLWVVLMQFPIFISTAEASFYFPHKWLHTPWLYQHIHAIHHEFDAPIAIAAAYAHPIEFLLSNVMPFCLGPLLCGSHMTTWMLWGGIGTIQISIAHLGYQFPFLGQRQAHDFHHSYEHGFTGMFDISFGIMDEMFHTNQDYNKAWQSTVAKNYSTPDYPVDKILAQHTAAVDGGKVTSAVVVVESTLDKCQL